MEWYTSKQESNYTFELLYHGLKVVFVCLHIYNMSLWCRIICYPALAREFQSFRVWGKFVFRTLELTDTSTNLANQVKVGPTLDQSRSAQSRGPERAHQNNEPSWTGSMRIGASGHFDTFCWIKFDRLKQGTPNLHDYCRLVHILYWCVFR